MIRENVLVEVFRYLRRRTFGEYNYNEQKYVCPICGSDYEKVIYYGLPVKLCINGECNGLFGICTFVLYGLPFNGFFLAYKHSYWRALYEWLFHMHKWED